MTSIVEKDGNIILLGDRFDLKIDVNRKIYVKPKKEKVFRSIDREVPLGLTSVEKKQLLYKLYFNVEAKLNNNEGVD